MKRIIDFLVAVSLLVCLFPLLLVIYLIAIVKIGTPVFFTQERLGKNNRVFTLFKLRSMTNEKDKEGNLLPDDQRLNSFGVFLRKTSLDEIPQLFNVLKGDMALVGPRPLFVRYEPFYTEREAKRHNVRPGITGLAQVSGRNNLRWDERLEMDVQYVENHSLLLDFKILYKTFLNVVKRDDVVIVPGQKFGPLDVERQKL